MISNDFVEKVVHLITDDSVEGAHLEQLKLHLRNVNTSQALSPTEVNVLNSLIAHRFKKTYSEQSAQSSPASLIETRPQV